MKKHFLLLTLCLVAITEAFAYTTVTVQDSISTNTHWTCDKQYLLKGYVYVTAGATLTIDPGVIIKGDKNTKGALIVERNAKLFANGTAAAPVIFTSNQPAGNRTYGDWGGVILCGNAPTNWNGNNAQVEGGPRSHYGGNDTHDNSGSMSYVRIEFAGIAFSPNNEVNGLTFCGVGDATNIDHIQVSYSGDDSYEWFGGTVNAKYLVAFRTWDDDFDTDNGFQGKVQFGMILRDPYAADQSGSKGFESDSYQSGTDTVLLTKPVFSNITAIGPLVSPGSTAFDPQFVSGAHIRRGSAISILNSVIAGWPCGILLDEAAAAYTTTSGNIGTDEMQIRNNIIAGIANPGWNKEIVYVKDGARSLTSTAANADTTGGTPVPRFSPYAGPWTFLLDPAFKNKLYPTEQTGVRLGSPFDLGNPNFVPTSTSPIVYNAAHVFNPNNPINTDTSNNYANYNVPTVAPDFATSKASDAFFTKVNFVGAFSGTGTTSDNWTNGWGEFDPLNTNYDYVCPLGVTNVSNYVESAHAYPNPASQSATITYNSIADGNVEVAIFDITGKVVANVFNGTQAKGEHNFVVDLRNLNEGIYVVSIKTGNSVKTLKLSVIK